RADAITKREMFPIQGSVPAVDSSVRCARQRTANRFFATGIEDLGRRPCDSLLFGTSRVLISTPLSIDGPPLFVTIWPKRKEPAKRGPSETVRDSRAQTYEKYGCVLAEPIKLKK